MLTDFKNQSIVWLYRWWLPCRCNTRGCPGMAT